jgi:hypothetical protein
MKRDYNIGDIITLRGRNYEVRSQDDYPTWGFCNCCGFEDGMYCNLRRYYSHFLKDCSEKKVCFIRTHE